MEKRSKILLALFIVIVIIRLTLAFSIPGFTYDSYFHLRQVEEITETGLPLYHDDLSYGGRDNFFLPFFHYFMAFFDFFLPLTLVAKIIPNLLIASLVFTTYLISKKLTKHVTASLLSAFIAGFLPILFSTNSFTVETLSLPLTFITIYAFFSIKKEALTQERKHIYIYIVSFLLLTLTSSSAILLLIGFLIYILLSTIEGKKINKAELEIIIFSLFFFVWVQFLFFKNSLLQGGLSFIWQNIPSRIIAEYFPKLSITQALVLVSFIPFIAGVYVVYKSLFQLKGQKSFLLISFVISTTLLTWLRLIKFKQSLAFFGIILAILFASFYKGLDKYHKKTKFAHLKKHLLPITVILLLISTIFPAINASLQQDTPTKEEIETFKWLQENTNGKSKILATLEEGHLVTFIGQRKNIMDNQFSLIEDVEERFSDLTTLYNTQFETEAVSLVDEYDIDYIVLTPSAKLPQKRNTIFQDYNTSQGNVSN